MLNLHLPLEFHSIFYDKDGNESDEAVDGYAKKNISNRTGNTSFYIKSYGCELFNPLINLTNYRQKDWKFLKYTEEKFNLYIQFLKTKQTRYLTLAERL